MKKETAQKAAKWWADQLRGHAKLDNGDNSESGFMGVMLGTILQNKEKSNQTSEQVDAFESCLVDVLMTEEPRYGFGVDYHPDTILQDAANLAGLSLGMTTLPWKTTMWIENEKVSVRCGYSADIVEL